MTSAPQVGIDVEGRRIALAQLQAELEAAGIALPRGLTLSGPAEPHDPMLMPTPNEVPIQAAGSRVYTIDDQGNPIDLPPEAAAIVEAHVPA